MTNISSEFLSEREEAKTRLEMLIKERAEYELIELYDKYSADLIEEVREFLDIILLREDYSNDCTIILGETRESRGSPGTSLLEGSLDEDDQITPQAIVEDIRIEKEMINYQFVTIKHDLKSENPAELMLRIAHEIAHTFTQYIISSYEKLQNGDSGLVDKLTAHEINFYTSIARLYQESFFPIASQSITEAYLLKISEFVARALTSPKDTVWGIYRDEVLNAFKEMYVSNTRKIISLSKYLHNVSELKSENK